MYSTLQKSEVPFFHNSCSHVAHSYVSLTCKHIYMELNIQKSMQVKNKHPRLTWKSVVPQTFAQNWIFLQFWVVELRSDFQGSLYDLFWMGHWNTYITERYNITFFLLRTHIKMTQPPLLKSWDGTKYYKKKQQKHIDTCALKRRKRHLHCFVLESDKYINKPVNQHIRLKMEKVGVSFS